MTAQQFRQWMKRHRLSIAGAAEAMGLSPRQIAYYRSGEQLLPRVVELACKYLDMKELK